jgi:hypothetical protein
VAILLHAWFSRNLAVVRRFAPTLIVLGVAAAVGIGIAYWGSTSTLLGAYGVVGQHGYALGPAVRWIARHLGDVFLIVLGTPLIATLILEIEAARGREQDPRVRALLAVVLAYTALLVAQVGIFASRFVGQLDERALISVAPPLFAAFAVWLHRRLPRPQPTASVAAVLVVAPVLFMPIKTLVNTFAVPSAFMVIPLLSLLERTSPETLELTWLICAAAIVVLTLFIPRRAAPALVLAIILIFGVSSG